MTVYELIQELAQYNANDVVTFRDRQIIVYKERSIKVPDTTLKDELDYEL